MAWSITDLGFLPGGIFSIAQAASSDGSVIVGVADADGFGDGHAFWWTQASGMVDLGVLSAGTQSIAYAVSADGQYVVGQSDGGSASSPNVVAVLWHVTAGGGSIVATELGYLGTGQNSVAWGISADGTTVSGSSTIIPGDPLTLPAHAFSWTSGGGMVAIALNGANTDGIGQAASANGSVIVGGSANPSDVPWKSVSGTVSSVPMPGGEVAGVVVSVDAAGDAMAGFSTTTPGGNLHAYRWTSGGGASLLGFLGTGDISDGLGISGDGSIVVGFSNNGASIFNQAFVWDQADGMEALPGLNTGAPGGAAQGISSDGSIIVGSSRGNDTPEPVLHAVYWSQETPPSPPSPPAPSPQIPVSLGRWRGQVGINWQGRALVGDAFSNVLGLSDFDVFTEYGNIMQFLVTTPPLHDDRKRIFVNRFEIEVEAGEGLSNGAAPQMMLDYSKDGGKTWIPLQMFRSMGKVGEYIKRLRWINMGMSRTWVFRLRYTDSARPAIIGSYWSGYKGLG